MNLTQFGPILMQAGGSSTNMIDAATDRIEKIKDNIITLVTTYGMKVLIALVVFMVGLFVVRWLTRLLAARLEKQQLEPPVRILLVRMVWLLLMLGVLMETLEIAGLNITTMLAGITVGGVGVAFALQGVLSNLFAGLTIIFTKPFRVGEYVEIAGVQGQVQHIELFSTSLLHPDLSKVVIPNRKIVGEILHNYGHIRQLSLTVGVAYGSNLTDVFSIVREILAANPRVLQNPVPIVGVSSLGPSAIMIAVCPWTKVTDFNPAQAEIYQAIMNRFRDQKISIPFPQHEVRLLNNP